MLPVDGQGRLELSLLDRLLTPRCRLLALTHASNVTGLRSDIAQAVMAARAAGAQVLVDGAQAAPHGPQDVLALGIDYYAFSGHKCYGPNGVGVLWGRRDRLDELSPLTTGGGMVTEVTLDHTDFAAPPARFEAGTPPIAPAVAMGTALHWMSSLHWPAIHAHEQQLSARALRGLAAMPGVRLIGPPEADQRTALISFTADGVHPHDLCHVLGQHQVCVRGGHHCAQPLLRRFGLDACTRLSIAMYNDEADIDAFLEATEHALKVLR